MKIRILFSLLFALALPTAAFADGSRDRSLDEMFPLKSKDGETFSDAEKAVKAEDYRKAIGILEKLLSGNERNVDVLNYLGYSHRQIGEFDKSMGYYQRALALVPSHRGANEYLGQLYLRLGDIKQAETQLARLARICGTGCEEDDSLKNAIARAKRPS
ncbi:MAG: tetratricopeptide repeat protein [Alphaproteobacteria bacterium]